MKTLHFVQDIPTPHNNALLKELENRPDVNLQIWYLVESSSQYGFDDSLSSIVKTPHIYMNPLVASRMLFRALIFRREYWFVVSWMNWYTKLLLMISFVTRRRMNFWFDLPATAQNGKRRREREIAEWVLRKSPTKVYCLGQNTVQYFLERRFKQERLVSLPVVLEPNLVAPSSEEVSQMREKLGIPISTFVVSTGSRLIFEKGFDLLIDSIALLDRAILSNIYVIIVGDGPEKSQLLSQISNLGLEDVIVIEGWMQEDEYRKMFQIADVIVHPARLDAYGGISLMAMSEGRPIIGTYTAGSAQDIVEDGLNGWLYSAEDIESLTNLLTKVSKSPELLLRASERMSETRNMISRSPRGASKTLVDNLI